MALPANISTRWVEGQFLTNVTDGPDPDQKPDGIAARGTVTFVAAVPYLPDATAEPNPATMLMIPRVAVLDDQGYICTPVRGTLTPAYRGIMLECTDDPDGGVVGWTWNAKYAFMPVDGVTPVVESHSFPLPASDIALDLTTVVKVPSSVGIGKEQAEVLAASAQAAAVRAAADAAKAMAAAEEALGAAVATDSNVSSLVGTEGTETHAAVAQQVESAAASKLDADEAASTYQSIEGLDAVAASKVNAENTSLRQAVDARAQAAAASKLDATQAADTFATKGELEGVTAVASDAGVAGLLTGDTETSAALTESINKQVDPRIVQVASEYIAGDRAVVDAAAAAVDANPKIAELQVAAGQVPVLEARVTGTESRADDQEGRIPKLVEADGWVVRDQAGFIALEVTGEGSTKVGQSEFRALGDNSPYSFVLRDEAGAIALAVDQAGHVTFGSGSSGASEVHVFIGAGQSNMSGRGTPFGEEYDPIDSRILQYGSRRNTAGRITPATVPLDMHDAPGGLSPLTVFAREYLKTQPANVSVLLVPAAHGGTAFYTTSETPLPVGYVTPNVGGGTWQYNRTEPVNLYQRMVAQTKAALAAAVSQLGVTPILKGFLWHQGEGDAGRTDQVGYAGHFDALVTDLRAQLAAPSLPVLLGGMSPDRIAVGANMLPIRAAHVDTPRRLTRSAFARAEADTGKYNDEIHFGREGVELLGYNFLEAYKRALANVSTSSPMPPRNVRATYVGGDLNIEFAYPLCRATSFTIEYSMDGGPWTSIARAVGMDYEETVTGLTGSVARVRVSTVNEVGTSAPSTPITAAGA